jgi:phosphonate transport system ATP-binding protein
VLTKIYGEEDWSATIRPVDEDAEQDEAADNVIALDTVNPHRDRLAGLT